MALFTGVQHLCTFSIVAPHLSPFAKCLEGVLHHQRRSLLMFCIDRPILRISYSLVLYRIMTMQGVTPLVPRTSSHWKWEILEHPLCSLDMSPCDYDLFAKVKEPLRGSNTRDELIRAIGQSIQNINKNGCADGVWCLPKYLAKGDKYQTIDITFYPTLVYYIKKLDTFPLRNVPYDTVKPLQEENEWVLLWLLFVYFHLISIRCRTQNTFLY